MATLYAVFEAVVLEKPLIERVLTVTGSAVARPRNLKARFGTGIHELLEECGGLASDLGKLVVGGPMRGVTVDSLAVPLTKRTSGIVAFAAADVRAGAELPCIRCGNCIEACPWDLVPTRLAKLIDMGEAAQPPQRRVVPLHGVRMLRLCVPLPDPPRRDPAGGQARAAARRHRTPHA